MMHQRFVPMLALVLATIVVWIVRQESAWMNQSLRPANSGDDNAPLSSSVKQPPFAPDDMEACAAVNPYSGLQQTTSSSSLFLRPGELPGYTGWARPSTTLAGHFVVTAISSRQTQVGRPWNVTVTCRGSAACDESHSMFYLRAYGPSVLTGTVVNHGNASYTVQFVPLDEGHYTVEVVLTYSRAPDLTTFPDENKELPYEGHLLPGFPVSMAVSAEGAVQPNSRQQPCRASDLVATSPGQALSTSRWVVTRKVMAEPYDYEHDSADGNINFRDYNYGIQSLGVALEYRHTRCTLLTSHQVVSALRSCRDDAISPRSESTKTPHLVLVGDSNMRLMSEMLRSWLVDTSIQVTLVRTMDGLAERLPQILQDFEDLRLLSDQYDFYLLFNSGLHDILRLCTHENPFRYGPKPQSHQQPHPSSNSSSTLCLEQYRGYLQQLVTILHRFPADVKVWQTTMAGWMKYGVYATNWPPDLKQKLPLDPAIVQLFNEVALDVLNESIHGADNESILVLDAYWMTLARPDHRDSREKNALGKRLVHAGPQTYETLLRQFGTLVLDSMCPNHDAFKEQPS